MLRSRSFPPPLSAPHTHGVDRQGHRSTRSQWVVGDLPAGTVESCRSGDVRSGRQAAFLSEGGKGTRQPGQRPSEACLRAPNVRHPWRFAAFRPLSLPQEKSKCQTRSPPRFSFFFIWPSNSLPGIYSFYRNGCCYCGFKSNLLSGFQGHGWLDRPGLPPEHGGPRMTPRLCLGAARGCASPGVSRPRILHQPVLSRAAGFPGGDGSPSRRRLRSPPLPLRLACDRQPLHPGCFLSRNIG